jgi:pyruvate dehydrogenase E2 component (dihydrolipoamide acetyltransferase)
MAEKIMMLALSPTMEMGTIAKWNAKEGDTIANGDVICEVETDKATMDYEAMVDGTLLKIVLPEGGQAKVGDTIAIVGEEGEDFAALVQEDAKKSTAVSAKADPTEAVPTEAPPAEAPAADAPAPAAEKTPAAASVAVSGNGKILASPLARRIAAENNLNLAAISGSGPSGRVVKRDVEAAISAGTARAKAVQPTASVIAAQASDQKLPISQKRQVIAQRLAESKYTAPHYYLKLSIQMDDLIASRAALNKSLRDQKISFNAFLIKFAAEALKRHPMVNASWNGDHILQHGSIDVGLAVAQPDGLITPVVRDTGNKGIVQIEEELAELIDKALNNRLTPEEYTGATFTISNLGSFGIEEFTAIINPPGSAIMAIGQTIKTPVVTEGDNIDIKSLMKVTLSCDHRIVDGAVGAGFLKDFKDMIENPIRVLY